MNFEEVEIGMKVIPVNSDYNKACSRGYLIVTNKYELLERVLCNGHWLNDPDSSISFGSNELDIVSSHNYHSK